MYYLSRPRQKYSLTTFSFSCFKHAQLKSKHFKIQRTLTASPTIATNSMVEDFVSYYSVVTVASLFPEICL